jgi:plastocyanin
MEIRHKFVGNTVLTRRSFLTAGSAAVAAGGAGCLESADTKSDDGGQDHDTADPHDHSHGEEVTGPGSHADVAMLTDEDGHYFAPHVVWVETGGTVTWTNESGSHTITAYHPGFDQPLRIPDTAEPWDSGMFSEDGVTFERQFEIDGVYDYFCIPHDYRAMVGTVIVGDPDPHDQPGLAEPQEELPEEARELFEKLNAQVHDALDHDHDH